MKENFRLPAPSFTNRVACNASNALSGDSTTSLDSSTIHDHRAAFLRATGMSFSVGRPEAVRPPTVCGRGFCALVGGTATGCDQCRHSHGMIQRLAASRGCPAQSECFAGLTELVAPVVCDGRHVATLWSGQVFRRVPTERDFVRAVAPLRGEWCAGEMGEARRAYFARPVYTTTGLHRAAGMLHDIALKFGAGWFFGENFDVGSSAVAIARRYVEEHLAEPTTPADVVGHVHLNHSYFCRLFKHETHLTLGEYIARAHVERALELLATSSLRITEVATVSGFGSIQQFNEKFKRYVGLSPSIYRGNRASRLTGSLPVREQAKVKFPVE